jgi:hypothetical protein
MEIGLPMEMRETRRRQGTQEALGLEVEGEDRREILGRGGSQRHIDRVARDLGARSCAIVAHRSGVMQQALAIRASVARAEAMGDDDRDNKDIRRVPA